ncbi:biotin--[acetyl-CoA-carboxylase] ligase [Sphingomonas sp. AX6]|uniref:biotin--[acetyl-CoA-carboxylase] ligase n=1 Tax=Sphingomonas sp. AX6 TaxID=2653171 RepID=UPI001915AB4A|nr:biotin--[acetyl-CoA-carboxylase] ligase [Sphingomonas sp. AX6]
MALAQAGAAEGLWLRADGQTAGRGRQGRAWESPVGNLYVSTLVRVRAGDPQAATLALVAAVALDEAVRMFAPNLDSGLPRRRESRVTKGSAPLPGFPPAREHGVGGEGDCLSIKWPNDLLIDGAKLTGILLERSGDAVVIGMGVNLAHHPETLDRPTTSLAAHGIAVQPAPFLDTLAEIFARWLSRWRSEGLVPIRARWIERAHPRGTALSARTGDGGVVDGLFDGLDEQGALILRLADGTRHVMHAGDVFLI